jgi:hypothetical protein
VYKAVIERYPDSVEITMDLREVLHPEFKRLDSGISEFTFANIYLFRHDHTYRLSRLADELLLISGKDGEETFFMLPFGLPDKDMLKELFTRFVTMKGVSQTQAKMLSESGYKIIEDRDNFDYLYSREELVNLPGNKFHDKRNLVNQFLKKNECEAKPLLEEYRDDAIEILEDWRRNHRKAGDYIAAKEALEKMEPLQLCGGIYYINDKPVAYSLGEEMAQGKWFVIHFEKAVTNNKYKGIYQFINQSFTSLLPEKYEMINREQDLGVLGLRKAKESYNPAGFVRKYKSRL